MPAFHWNARRFFESHEDWETIWHECEGPHRLWIQALIQTAAGFHHVDHGTASGFVKLMRSARAKMAGYAGDRHGLDAARLEADLAPWFAFAERVAAGAPLHGPATPAFPTLVHAPGVVAAPLPFEDPPDDA
jgi:hypothetical protein